MAYTIDFLGDGVHVWSRTPSGVTVEMDAAYTPTIYVDGERSALEAIRPHLACHPRTERVATERWRPGWRADERDVLAVDVGHVDDVTQIASQVRQWGDTPDTYRLFNVDLSREFRYCLETETDPTPSEPLRTLEIGVPKPSLSDDRLLPLTIGETTIDAETRTGRDRRRQRDERDALETLAHRLETEDPDVLVVSHADVIPTIVDRAAALEVDCQLGRLAEPTYQRLAGRSTYESYGTVGHSPARYNVPGRAIVDRSNTFFWHQSGLPGVVDLIERSHKPIQELAWASIGNVLTAIQIREATRQGVLVPWKPWRPELFKSMATLHEADRGGYILSPEVGVHEDVAELDFASLYPNIIATRNVSPETVRCDCHPDRSDVPGLGYAICPEEGYLPGVLEDIIADRQAFKRELREGGPDAERERELRAKAEALKWILVSCFGYQGFSNAKFGRIECHEAINAYARELLLETKAILEDGGWRMLHGIVDSLWVTPASGEGAPVSPRPLEELCAEITDRFDIPLEYERHYDWIAFAPCRDAERGALNRYFGKDREGEFKIRGIECRQRNTPPYVKDCQRELLEVVDETRDPEAVCDHFARQCHRLRTGAVDPEDLIVRTTPSKDREEYSQYTTTVAALERADRQGIDVHPGESLAYVVIDDEKDSSERVALAYDGALAGKNQGYDADYYVEELIRAATSVVSPLGWRREDLEATLADTEDLSLSAFTPA